MQQRIRRKFNKELYYNALAQNWTGSPKAQYVRACPGNSYALQMQRLYVLQINK